MSEEIGKISKPQADNVQLKRKLYLVQNIQNYFPGNEDFENLLLEYWNSISDQLDNLEKTAGTINYIYIEGMYQEYDVASKLLNENNKWCLNTIDSRIKSGSNYKKIEDENNYKELIDWTRIAQLGFVSENAKEVTEKNYTNIITERSKIIHDELNGLNEGEAALFIISSLFIPANGLIIGSSLALDTTCIFDNVCDDTWPILSPVINARAFIFFATSFAIIIIYRLKKTTQNFSGTCSIIFS